ncbi:MAG TPA: hypothetical protein VEE84_05120, partial [Burkholderiaceae bacterium]|nr:hypothetical protein [Burkholderiaceae bacterium]
RQGQRDGQLGQEFVPLAGEFLRCHDAMCWLGQVRLGSKTRQAFRWHRLGRQWVRHRRARKIPARPTVFSSEQG